MERDIYLSDKKYPNVCREVDNYVKLFMESKNNTRGIDALNDAENSKETLVKTGNLKESEQEPLVLGTKKGVCPICKETKTLFLLRYELVMCESCLKNIAQILELANNTVSKEELMLHFGAVEDVEEIKDT